MLALHIPRPDGADLSENDTMRRFLKIVGVLLALFILWSIAVGLGLTQSVKSKKPKVKQAILNDFEDAKYDLLWSTGGYITLESANRNQTHGKKSMKAVFLLPSQFFPTPTPQAVWQPSMKLSFETVTKLTKNDWSKYTVLYLDAFNNEDRVLNYSLKIDDGKGYSHTYTGQLWPKRVTNIAAPLDELKTARMDLSVIRALSFSVDVTGAVKPVELYLDFLRLEGPLDDKKSKGQAPPVPVKQNLQPYPTPTVPPLPPTTPKK